MICRICGNDKDNQVVNVKEMNYGTGDNFDYFVCNNCGCLQICDMPSNMADFYPKNYSSHNLAKPNFMTKFFIYQRDHYAFFKKGIIGKYIYQRKPNAYLLHLGDVNMGFDSKILDVGSGSGWLIKKLKNQGYKNLTGVDPFIDGDIMMGGNVKILNKYLPELGDEKYDYIIFNHSFEHAINQLEYISKASQILSPDGTCIISMPVKTDYIWNLYGPHWVQLDAPRHVLIHTLKSFQILMDKTDLSIENVIFYSNAFQFWASEQYKRNIILTAPNSYRINPKNSIFSREEMNEWDRRAEELNKTQSGDQAIFILNKK